MSLCIAALNSGSNGNCYYVGNEKEAILIDAGISSKEASLRMRRLGLAPEKLKAVFITHEHGDHIKGLRSIIKKFKVPVFITTRTLVQGRLKIRDQYVRHFLSFEPIR